MPSRVYNNWQHPPTGGRGYASTAVHHVDIVEVQKWDENLCVKFQGLDYTALIVDTPERLADMLRFALDEVTALLPADTTPPAEPVDEADIDTVSEADWDDVLTDRFGGEAA